MAAIRTSAGVPRHSARQSIVSIWQTITVVVDGETGAATAPRPVIIFAWVAKARAIDWLIVTVVIGGHIHVIIRTTATAAAATTHLTDTGELLRVWVVLGHLRGPAHGQAISPLGGPESVGAELQAWYSSR